MNGILFTDGVRQKDVSSAVLSMMYDPVKLKKILPLKHPCLMMAVILYILYHIKWTVLLHAYDLKQWDMLPC